MHAGRGRIGVDLGGSKLEVLHLDDDGTEHGRRRVATPAGLGPIVEAIGALVEAFDPGGLLPVGVGVAGPVGPDGLLLGAPNLPLPPGPALREALAARLGRVPAIANDALCLALSEVRDGAARGMRVVFAAVLGTGIGGALAIDGHPWPGRHGIAGEWGHNPAPSPDLAHALCGCGRRGCLETVISGPALLRRARADGLSVRDVAELDARAEAGDAAAEAVLAAWEAVVARALADVVDLIDPEAIVLGGGLSRMSRVYRNLPGLIARGTFAVEASTPLLPALHGDSSGVRGAAWLAAPP